MLCDKFQIIERISIPEVEGSEEDNDGEIEELEGEDQSEEEDEEEEDEEEDEEEEDNEEELTKEEMLENKRKSPFGTVVRSKGFFWLATRYILRGEWSSAGSMLTLNAGPPWFGATAKEFWPEDQETIESIPKDFQDVHEDRRQEIVLIGFKIKPSKLQKMFDSCLLTDEEFKEYNKVATKRDLVLIEKNLAGMYEDGFEDWDFVQEADDHDHDENKV